MVLPYPGWHHSLWKVEPALAIVVVAAVTVCSLNCFHFFSKNCCLGKTSTFSFLISLWSEYIGAWLANGTRSLMIDNQANGRSSSRFFFKIKYYLKYKPDNEGKGGVYFIIDTERAEEKKKIL
jgi:hypothetical protein